MRDTDLAYYAGLFDGEGAITLHPTQISTPNQRKTYFLSLHVTFTDEEPILELQTAFGGNLFTYEGSKNNKTAYRWVVTRNKAQDFLAAILPYLRIKRHRAELALEFHAHKRRGGYHSQEYIDFEEDYKKTFLVLNRRGRYQ